MVGTPPDIASVEPHSLCLRTAPTRTTTALRYTRYRHTHTRCLPLPHAHHLHAAGTLTRAYLPRTATHAFRTRLLRCTRLHCATRAHARHTHLVAGCSPLPLPHTCYLPAAPRIRCYCTRAHCAPARRRCSCLPPPRLLPRTRTEHGPAAHAFLQRLFLQDREEGGAMFGRLIERRFSGGQVLRSAEMGDHFLDPQMTGQSLYHLDPSGSRDGTQVDSGAVERKRW